MVYILPEVETMAAVFGPRFAQVLQARAAR
jgi:hypothetical protein